MSIETIRSDFEFLDDWEDRYRYVIELGKALTPLADDDYSESNKVRGCASQVWLTCTRKDDQNGGPPRLHFAGDSDAHIVRGLIAILLALYSGKTAEAIVEVDAASVFAELGLKEHLTPQRSNGFAAMVERIRADANAELASRAATPTAS